MNPPMLYEVRVERSGTLYIGVEALDQIEKIVLSVYSRMYPERVERPVIKSITKIGEWAGLCWVKK